MTHVVRKSAASVVVLFALAGCAGGSGDALQSLSDGNSGTVGSAAEAGSHPQAAPKQAVAPGKLIASVPDKLAAAKSARMDMTMNMTGFGGGTDGLEITVDGSYDFGSLDAQMNMSMHGMPGAGDVDVEMRMVDGVMYMDIESLAAMMGGAGGSGLPDDVKWLKLDLEQMMQSMGGGSSGGFGFASDSSDPTKTFEMLRDIADEVETLGREEVRGVDTTHYRAVVDLAKATDSLPSDVKSMLPDLGVAPGGLPLQVWIDDDGLLRRMDMHFDMGDLLAGTAGSVAGDAVVTMRADVYDYGVEVDVEAPPAGETYDMSSMLGSLGGVTPGA